MRWVLIRPLNQSLYYDPEIQEPLGIEYIGALLQRHGCKVLILDSALDDLTDERVAKRTLSFEPDVIGFSITTDREINSVNNIYHFCKRIRKERQFLWVAGGNFITSETINAQKLLPVEFRLVKFEAEHAIENFLNEKGNDINYQLNVITEGIAVNDLDTLPFPLRPYHQYLLNYGWAFNLQGSRGCCSCCKYCASSGMRAKKGAQWRGRSVNNIVDEIEHLIDNYNARTFNFVDEDFLGPPAKAHARAKAFSSELLSRNIEITFGIQIRPNSLSEETIKWLVAGGLKYVFMGIESDDPADFRKWGRVYCRDTWKWVQLLLTNGVEVNAGTLLFHPDSTPAKIRAFSEKLHTCGLLNYRTAINRLDAMPGSYFHELYCSTNSDITGSSGIFPIPFAFPGMENFYQTVLKVLSPIEIPSMHALCAMPIAQTKRIFEKNESVYLKLKKINNQCDDIVSECFFRLLKMFEDGTFIESEINQMFVENKNNGKEIVYQLIKDGFVRTPDTILHAVENENV